LAQPGIPFFLCDPEGDGMTFYRTVEARDAAAAEAIPGYLDDTQSDDVTGVMAGAITHHTVACEVQFAPVRKHFDSDEEFENAQSEFGGLDYEYCCNYKLVPLADPGESTKRSGSRKREGEIGGN
jgi:hypothetical protein